MILAVLDARKHGVKFVWLYIAGGLAIAISPIFPLILIARELRMDSTEVPRLNKSHATLLGAVAARSQTIWADEGWAFECSSRDATTTEDPLCVWLRGD